MIFAERHVLLRLADVAVELADVGRRELEERLAGLHVLAELDDDLGGAAVDRRRDALGAIFVEADLAGEHQLRAALARRDGLDLHEGEVRIVRRELDPVGPDVLLLLGLGGPLGRGRTAAEERGGEQQKQRAHGRLLQVASSALGAGTGTGFFPNQRSKSS